MPRAFDVSADTPAAVQEVFDAFRSERYWRERLAAYGSRSMSLDLLDVGDGVVTVASTQDLRHDVLPTALAKAFPKNLKVVRTETWRQVEEDRVTGDVTIAASGVPGSGAGSAVLAGASPGCRLTFTGTLEVRIPIVGGRIEKYIADQLVEQIPDVQGFTTRWIADHGC